MSTYNWGYTIHLNPLTKWDEPPSNIGELTHLLSGMNHQVLVTILPPKNGRHRATARRCAAAASGARSAAARAQRSPRRWPENGEARRRCNVRKNGSSRAHGGFHSHGGTPEMDGLFRGKYHENGWHIKYEGSNRRFLWIFIASNSMSNENVKPRSWIQRHVWPEDQHKSTSIRKIHQNTSNRLETLQFYREHDPESRTTWEVCILKWW